LTLEILSECVGRGVTVDFQYKTMDDFKNRGKITVNIVRQLELLGFNLFFPMDCDEFIAVDVDGEVSIDPVEISSEISKHKNEEKILRIKYAIDNNQLEVNVFTKTPQRKCFYYGNILKKSDHGSHECESYKFGVDHIVTNITYIHYHYRSYEDYLRSAKNKLRPWTQDFSIENLINYKKEKKAGFHLVDKVLQDPALYYCDQRGRLNSKSNISLDSFRNFMEARGLLPKSNSKLINYCSDEMGWIVAIDHFKDNENTINIKGWAFNSNKIKLNILRLRLGYTISEPIFIKNTPRPDVVRVHEEADLWCGFEIEYTFKRIIEVEQMGCFFASNESILGHYIGLSRK
jgi:hypothetical protein